MSNRKLAKALARHVFATCDSKVDRTQRIEFKGGIYPTAETDLGGLCEIALEDVLLAALYDQGVDHE